MWSGPRNISTAMMRSWGSRSDTFVVDEPYYAYYLSQNDLDHPGREEVLREGELDVEKISNGLVNDTNDNCSIYYQKHITHHLLDSINREWMKSVVNCFLIRDPKDMIISYSRVHPDLNMHLLGLEEQSEIFEHVKDITGEIPPIIDAKDVLMNPRYILDKLCNKIGVIFSNENVFVTTIILGFVLSCFCVIISLTLFVTEDNFCKLVCINFFQKFLFSWINMIVKYLKIIT